MNIKEAKEQIRNAMTAYFAKDENGSCLIPTEKQRPVFLVGPPGIGKTAVMEQIASEMGVGLLTYSMTHHTRQSALGLPFISHRKYGDTEFDVSEYTMSEIISSVYELMEKSGVKEGILFLDEINCVSETLSPIMLQFLQYKIFGRHRVPDGWIVVTAGNPPEYNRSAREFDIATSDRLKKIVVQPEFAAWKEYAYAAGVHAAVITYLESKKDNFYSIKTTVDGKSFVTARGWDDLSRIMQVYEMTGIEVDEKLIVQYVQDKKIASDFAAYYGLFRKYRSDYKISDVLSGNAPAEIKKRAAEASFDERVALLGLFLDVISAEARSVVRRDKVLVRIRDIMREYKKQLFNVPVVPDPNETLKSLITAEETAMEKRRSSGILDRDSRDEYIHVLKELRKMQQETEKLSEAEPAFELIRALFGNMTDKHRAKAEQVKKELSNTFGFINEVYSDGEEMLIFITELTANIYTAQFIARFGCDEYIRFSDSLMLGQRGNRIKAEIENLDI